MLYFATMRCAASGSFLGGCFVNEETFDLAVLHAGELAPKDDGVVEVLCVRVPAGDIPIPAIGRLLSFDELQAAGLDVVEVDVSTMASGAAGAEEIGPSHFALGRPLWDG